MDDLFRLLDLHAARVISGKHAYAFKRAISSAKVEWQQMKEQLDQVAGRIGYSGKGASRDDLS